MRFNNCLSLAALAALLAGGSAQAAEIVPYEAVYRLSLKNERVEGWADNSSGTMEVKLSRDCFHYGYDRKLQFNVVYTNEKETRLVIEDRTRESLSGRHLWFWSRTTLNDETVGIVSGSAERPEEGAVVEEREEVVEVAKIKKKDLKEEAGEDAADVAKEVEEKAAEEEADREKKEKKKRQKVFRYLGVQVSYRWPEESEIEVPQNVIFPFTALRSQLESLSNQSLLPELLVFDGSNGQGAFKATYRPAVADSNAERPVPDGDAELLNTPAWRYTTQYVLLESENQRPARVETVKVHENGIASEMVIDFGPFAVEGHIAWLKGSDIPQCK